MGKDKEPKSQRPEKRSKGLPKAGDAYEYTLEVTMLDIDSDGMLEVLAKHDVRRNGERFVDGSVTWYGLPEGVADQFMREMKSAGIEPGTKSFRNFAQVMKEWRKVTQFFKQINDFGDAIAAGLRE